MTCGGVESAIIVTKLKLAVVFQLLDVSFAYCFHHNVCAVEFTTNVWLHHPIVPDNEHHEDELTHDEPFHKEFIAFDNPTLSVHLMLRLTGVPA